MDRQSIFSKHPEFNELIHFIRYEVQQSQRPAEEIILDDEDVMMKLKISKRTLQYLKSDRLIPFHTLPNSPRTYYFLSDILQALKDNRVESVIHKSRIK